jgi:hypothetical protein
MIRRLFARTAAAGAALVLLVGCARPAAAQPRVDVAAGYATLHDNDISEDFPAGWFVSVSAMPGWLGVAGEVSGNYKTVNVFGGDVRLSVHTFMAGPKFAARLPVATPFFQVLFGAARLGANAVGPESETDFAMQPGGGVDVRLSNAVGLRVGANYRLIRSLGETSKESQLVVGIVFRP